MLPRVLAACLLAIADQACIIYVSTSPTAPSSVVIILTTGTWVLSADRAWCGDPGSPTYPRYSADPLRETDYQAAAGPTYSILIGSDGQSVSIAGSPPIRGTRSEQSPERVSYALDEGLVAGGRLVVWREGTGYQAELTLYGSGVPVVKSERGTFVRVRGS